MTGRFKPPGGQAPGGKRGHMTQEPPPSKEKLLENIRGSRAALEKALYGLTEAQLTAPNRQGAWSIKDILAHIAAWERLTVDRLHSALTGAPLAIPPIGTDEEIDAMNASVYAENRQKPLVEVRADFEAAHQEIYELVSSLDERFLHGPLPFEWAKDRPAWTLIAANTYWHYPDHSDL